MELTTAVCVLLTSLLSAGSVMLASLWQVERARAIRYRAALAATTARCLALPGLLSERNACLDELAAREAREADLESALEIARDRARSLEVEVEELRAAWGRS